MVAIVDAAQCVGCGYCVDICPVAGVVLNEAMVAVIDKDACMGCGVCEYECPALAVVMGDDLPLAAPQPCRRQPSTA